MSKQKITKRLINSKAVEGRIESCRRLLSDGHYCLGPHRNQCDQIWPICESFGWKKFFQKRPKCTKTFLGYPENKNFKVKTARLFWRNRATFYVSIESHRSRRKKMSSTFNLKPHVGNFPQRDNFIFEIFLR